MTLVIRRATVEDIPRLMPLAERFRDHVAMRDVPLDEIERSLHHVLALDTGIAFYYERAATIYGVIVGVETTTWFSRDVKLAAELAWWIDPEWRRSPAAIRLLEAFESWAHERGCRYAVTHSIDTEEGGSKPADSILTRLGWARREQTYAKEIDHARVL